MELSLSVWPSTSLGKEQNVGVCWAAQGLDMNKSQFLSSREPNLIPLTSTKQAVWEGANCVWQSTYPECSALGWGTEGQRMAHWIPNRSLHTVRTYLAFQYWNAMSRTENSHFEVSGPVAFSTFTNVVLLHSLSFWELNSTGPRLWDKDKLFPLNLCSFISLRGSLKEWCSKKGLVSQSKRTHTEYRWPEDWMNSSLGSKDSGQRMKNWKSEWEGEEGGSQLKQNCFPNLDLRLSFLKIMIKYT